MHRVLTALSARSASRRKASRSAAVTYFRSPSTVCSPVPADRAATEAAVPGAGPARPWRGVGSSAPVLGVRLVAAVAGVLLKPCDRDSRGGVWRGRERPAR